MTAVMAVTPVFISAARAVPVFREKLYRIRINSPTGYNTRAAAAAAAMMAAQILAISAARAAAA
jgi:hypothetical protein